MSVATPRANHDGVACLVWQGRRREIEGIWGSTGGHVALEHSRCNLPGHGAESHCRDLYVWYTSSSMILMTMLLCASSMCRSSATYDGHHGGTGQRASAHDDIG